MLLKGALVGSIKGLIARNWKLGAAFAVGVVALVLLVLAVFPSNKNAAQMQESSGASILFQQAVGSTAPDFSLQGMNGSAVRLSDYRGKTVVLFFSEGLMCLHPCGDQMASLSTDPRFNNDNVVVFSIVTDPKDPWLSTIGNVTLLQNNNVTGLEKAKLLFDANASVSMAYDVMNLPSSMHKGRFPGHTYFVIDKNGIIRYTLDDPSMNVNNNDKVAAALNNI